MHLLKCLTFGVHFKLVVFYYLTFILKDFILDNKNLTAKKIIDNTNMIIGKIILTATVVITEKSTLIKRLIATVIKIRSKTTIAVVRIESALICFAIALFGAIKYFIAVNSG